MLLATAPTTATAQWRADVGLLQRYHAGADLLPLEARFETSLTLQAAFYHRWDDGRQAFSAEPYLRTDLGKTTRARFDFRELTWAYYWDRWELRLGMREVFWGVTESAHLVDVVNQRELRFGERGYAKLGQPMVNVSTVQAWGTVDVLLLPWFRERDFSEGAGALWTPLPIDAGAALFESGARNHRLDWAVRWSHALGQWDLGVTHFAGTARDPRFIVGNRRSVGPTLIPYYEVVQQTAVDVQRTAGAWLWKLEGATTDHQGGRYLAAAAGLERWFADYFSAFVEYLYDSRGDRATTSFADDIFAGVRLLTHEGHVQAGAYVDRKTANSVLSLTVTHRVAGQAMLMLDVQAFLGSPALEPAYAPRQRSYVALGLSRYF